MSIISVMYSLLEYMCSFHYLGLDVRNNDDVFVLTHISLASFLWDVGKQCRPRPERGVWSGSTLFAYRLFYQDLNKNRKQNHQTTPKMEMDWSNW